MQELDRGKEEKAMLRANDLDELKMIFLQAEQHLQANSGDNFVTIIFSSESEMAEQLEKTMEDVGEVQKILDKRAEEKNITFIK